eukprot:923267_1
MMMLHLFALYLITSLPRIESLACCGQVDSIFIFKSELIMQDQNDDKIETFLKTFISPDFSGIGVLVYDVVPNDGFSNPVLDLTETLGANTANSMTTISSNLNFGRLGFYSTNKMNGDATIELSDAIASAHDLFVSQTAGRELEALFIMDVETETINRNQICQDAMTASTTIIESVFYLQLDDEFEIREIFNCHDQAQVELVDESDALIDYIYDISCPCHRVDESDEARYKLFGEPRQIEPRRRLLSDDSWKLGTVWFRLKNVDSGECIYDTFNPPVVWMNKFWYYECNDNESDQFWKLDDLTTNSGYFRLSSKETGLCIVNRNSGYFAAPDDSNFDDDVCSESDDMYWSLYAEDEDAGTFKLRNKHTDSCIFQNDDGRFGVSECNILYTDQVFTVSHVGDIGGTVPTTSTTEVPTNRPTVDDSWEEGIAYFRLQNVDSEKCIYYTLNPAPFWDNFGYSECEDNADQYWKLDDLSTNSGYFRLKSKATGLCIVNRNAGIDYPDGWNFDNDDCGESDDMYWSFHLANAGAGTFRLQNKKTEECMFQNDQGNKLGVDECGLSGEADTDQIFRVSDVNLIEGTVPSTSTTESPTVDDEDDDDDDDTMINLDDSDDVAVALNDARGDGRTENVNDEIYEEAAQEPSHGELVKMLSGILLPQAGLDPIKDEDTLKTAACCVANLELEQKHIFKVSLWNTIRHSESDFSDCIIPKTKADMGSIGEITSDPESHTLRI